MPYSGPDDSSLPSHIASLPAASRRQFVAVFNAAYANCRSPKVGGAGDPKACEAVAFRFANGVITKAAKEGRVLSGANLQAMLAAMRSMIAVLRAAGYSAEEMMTGGKAEPTGDSQSSLPEPTYRPLLRQALAAVFSSYKARTA
jgi:hypothetical protein